MMGYASQTGTKRNLAALRDAGWGLLIARTGHWQTHGFHYCMDNGAWFDFKSGQEFDAPKFERMLDMLGAGADWVASPDIVAGGIPSLDRSLLWLPRCASACRLVLIPVQDGMTPDMLRPHVGPNVGIFLGGSTEWKLANMKLWGDFCTKEGCYYHVARVNTARRIKEALACEADSFDGSSATRYSVTLPLLDVTRRQRDLLL